MTLTHLILVKTIDLLIIPVGFFATAFLIAFSDFAYGRLFKTSRPTETHPFL
jgi:predicted permease